MTFDPTPIKLNQYVFRDRPYRHPQLGVVVGREFYDRWTERARVLDILARDRSVRVVTVVAERRMGKTSILRHVIEQLRGMDGFVPVQLPPGGSLHSADDFLVELADQTAAALGLLCDDVPEVDAGLAVDEQIALMCDLCAGRGSVILCLDELDACLEHLDTPPVERERIAGLLSGLTTCKDCDIRLLATMIRAPEHLTGGFDSRLEAGMVRISLPPFSRLDLDEMLLELAANHLDASLNGADLARIYAQSGGWPFFAKLILVCMGEAEPGPERLARGLENAARHGAINEAMEHIFRNYFDRDEKGLAISLAVAPGATLTVADLAPRAAAALNRLVARHYLQIDPGGCCGFRIGLLAAWFRQWSKFAEMVEAHMVAAPA